jgi:hypothetical protein
LQCCARELDVWRGTAVTHTLLLLLLLLLGWAAETFVIK